QARILPPAWPPGEDPLPRRRLPGPERGRSCHLRGDRHADQNRAADLLERRAPGTLYLRGSGFPAPARDGVQIKYLRNWCRILSVSSLKMTTPWRRTKSIGRGVMRAGLIGRSLLTFA